MKLWHWFILGFVITWGSGCMLSLSTETEQTQAQLKALSQILQETDVQTCTRATIAIGRYASATTIWAGRAPLETCIKAMSPY